MKSTGSKHILDFIIKGLLLLYIAIISFPIRYHFLKGHSIDSSWRFAINYFAANKIIFGKDVIFNYGPLAYLFLPLNIGPNMVYSTLFLAALWIIFLSLLFNFAARKYHSTTQIFTFSLFITFGMQPLYAYGNNDYFLCFLGLLFLSYALTNDKWRIYYFIALLSAALLFLVKFSTAIITLSAILSYILVLSFMDRKKAFRAFIYFMVGFPSMFILSYYLYHQSFQDMVSYFRGMYEITSGYSAAMSLEGPDGELLLSFITFILYAAMMLVLYMSRQISFRLSVIFIAPMFVLFKHGFVRQDSLHVTVFFSFATVFFGILMLFSKFNTGGQKSMAYIIGLLLICSSFVGQNSYYNVLELNKEESIDSIRSVLGYSHTRRELIEKEKNGIKKYILPDALKNVIGSEKIGILTVELSYVAANSLNYSPFPVFHMYQANTPYLDNLNSAYLENDKTAPKFILIDENLGVLDNRSTLTDVPSTWLSLYKWYDVEYPGDTYSILLRRESPRFDNIVIKEIREYRVGDIINIPFSNHPILARVSMDLSVTGRLAKLFFRVPEISMVARTCSGELFKGRVVPTIRNGLFINYLPLSFESINRMFRMNEADTRIDGFKLTGKGTGCYKDGIIVEFYEIPDLTIRYNG
jgi:hypothetical protein